MRFAVDGQHALRWTVDLGHPAAQAQFDQVVTAVVVARKGQLAAVPVLGVAGEPDPVVGGVGFLGQHGYPPGAVGVTSAQRLDETVTDHAMADHHDVSC